MPPADIFYFLPVLEIPKSSVVSAAIPLPQVMRALLYVSSFDCDLPGTFMRVLNVLPDSGAARARLRAGDLLFKIDGRPARDALFATKDGDFAVRLSPGGQAMKLTFAMTTLVP